MKLAARGGRIVPSPTLSITATAKAMAAQGIDVIDFASGEPDFDTPEPVKAAAEKSFLIPVTRRYTIQKIEKSENKKQRHQSPFISG